MSVRGYVDTSHALDWPFISDGAWAGWRNLRVATEWGAAGIAALLARQEIAYSVVEQSWTGTGFDYWLADESGSQSEKARMEVSGLLAADMARFNARVKEKIQQTRQSDALGLPAYVVVVEFSEPAARIEKRAP